LICDFPRPKRACIRAHAVAKRRRRGLTTPSLLSRHPNITESVDRNERIGHPLSTSQLPALAKEARTGRPKVRRWSNPWPAHRRAFDHGHSSLRPMHLVHLPCKVSQQRPLHEPAVVVGAPPPPPLPPPHPALGRRYAGTASDDKFAKNVSIARTAEKSFRESHTTSDAMHPRYTATKTRLRQRPLLSKPQSPRAGSARYRKLSLDTTPIAVLQRDFVVNTVYS